MVPNVKPALNRHDTQVSKIRVLLQQLDIQADGPHEKIDTSQTLRCHGRRKGLRQRHCVENSVLDSKNKSCLLVMVGANTHGGKKLPYIDIFAAIDTTREDEW
jgi:hypothetical protein